MPPPTCSDSASQIRSKLGISSKQFKTMIASAERRNLLERFVHNFEPKLKSTSKPISVRMVRLNESHLKAMIQSAPGRDQSDDGIGNDEMDDSIDGGEGEASVSTGN